jgi:hypothetical protein
MDTTIPDPSMQINMNSGNCDLFHLSITIRGRQPTRCGARLDEKLSATQLQA